MDKGIWVRVRNYEKYKGRTDLKKKTWFRCENDILEDEDFFDFDFVEICVWIYVLGQASKKQSAEVFISFERAERFARLKRKDVISAIEKLQRNQLEPVIRTDHVRDTNGSRTDAERDPNATNERTNTTPQRELTRSLPIVAKVWNEKTGALPKVEKWTPARDRAAKQVSVDAWTRACEKVLASEFLSGRSGKWVGANFDWMLKPANLQKVLEGNYDNRGETEKQTLGGIVAV